MKRKTGWVGIVDGKIHFYSHMGHYGDVLYMETADLFSTRSAAKRCYEEVRQIELRTPSPRRRRAERKSK